MNLRNVAKLLWRYLAMRKVAAALQNMRSTDNGCNPLQLGRRVFEVRTPRDHHHLGRHLLSVAAYLVAGNAFPVLSVKPALFHISP